MNIGNKLAKLRTKKRITQKELSESTGIPLTTLRNHEYGNREMTAIHLLKYAKALKVKADVFARCEPVREVIHV